MSQDIERVTSASSPTDVTTQKAGELIDFAWPPSSARWAPESPLGPFESERGLLDHNASGAATRQAGDTTRSDNNRAGPIPREPSPARPQLSRHAPSAALKSSAHNGRGLLVRTGPVWVAVLVLLVVVVLQGAFILKTQFRPAATPAERSTNAPPVRTAATQPLARTTIVPADVTTPLSPLRSSSATQEVSGRLIVRSDPAGAKVLVDGRSQGVTPLNLAGVAAGSHRVVVSGAGRDVQQTVQVEAGSTVSIVIPLRPTAERSAYGRVSIVAPLEVDIFEGDALVGTSRMPELVLSPGPHTLRVVNEAFGFQDTRKIEVAAGERLSVPVYVPEGELNINALPWAEVSIDGNRIGETPLGNLKLAVGPHVATFRHPELGEKTVSFAVKVGVPARVTADMRK